MRVCSLLCLRMTVQCISFMGECNHECVYACVLFIYTPPQLLTLLLVAETPLGVSSLPKVCYGSVCVMDNSTCLLLSVGVAVVSAYRCLHVGVAVVSACRCGCIVANNRLCEVDCFINMRLLACECIGNTSSM